ncbi:MAG TPA: rhomboid family intramembrane serine protease, partial [Bacteroidota bacterium]|nr:rhomboid family intramembrane serine protease [Bacteroidota bacterium]
AWIDRVFALRPIGYGFAPWQLVTYMFLHAGLMHLLFNMFALWMFGMELENEWGAKKFLTYYFLCGIGGGVSHLLLAPFFGAAGPTVGASGAIYGVLLAFGMMYPDRPIFVYFLLPIRARYFVILYIALELYNGVTGTPDGVAHFAHLGGAAVGLVYLLIDRRLLPGKKFFEYTKSRFVQPEHVNQYSAGGKNEISDAKFYELHNDEDRVNQQRVDEILDKISQNGYQSLSDEEKRILFDASKKLN